MSDFKVGDEVYTRSDTNTPAIITDVLHHKPILYKISYKREGRLDPSLFTWAKHELLLIEHIEPEEYPLSFQEALKAAIDGKVVEDEYGILVSFDIDKCQFIVDSGNEKTEVKGEGLFKDKSEYKYRIYEPKPKFKRGDFVVWDEMYYRILNVHQSGSKFTYDLVYDQHKFNASESQHEDIDESDLYLVDILK